MKPGNERKIEMTTLLSLGVLKIINAVDVVLQNLGTDQLVPIRKSSKNLESYQFQFRNLFAKELK